MPKDVELTKPGEETKRSGFYFDGIPVKGKYLSLFLLVMVAYFFEQWDNNNFGFIAASFVQSWGVDMTVVSQITGWYFIAMMAGGLLGGVISDLIGRRKTFLLSLVIFSAASIVNGFTNHLGLFIIARLFTGFGVFCMMIVSITYLSEMSPAESRGKWQGLISAIALLCLPLMAVTARLVVPISAEAYRFLFYFGGVGFLIFFIALKGLKESPRWLVAKGRVAEAEQIIYDLTGQRIDLSDAAKKVPPKTNFAQNIAGIFSKAYLRRTIVILIMTILVTIPMMSSVNWITLLLNQKGFTVEQSLMISALALIGSPIGCFICSLVSDKGGRKIPFAVFAFLYTGFQLLFAFSGTNFWYCVVLYFLANTSFPVVTYVLMSYIAESYPTNMRNTATGLQNGVARLSVSLFQPLIPLIYAAWSFPGVIGSFAACSFLAGAVMLVFGWRTGGRSLEEIN
ncbi:MAG: MFS transporter [Gracilibacteraceae bacterium]|jgi:putative MFS transporter|nr:MFS transporter [Gracilibacteraceae bacterium]